MSRKSPARGRPRERPATSTAFSRWFTEQLARHELDARGAADRLGVALPTIYDWISGNDPRLVDLIQRGIISMLAREPLLPDGTVLSLDSAPHSGPRRVPVPPSLQHAQDRLARLYWKDHGKSDDFKMLAALIARLEPDLSAALTTQGSVSGRRAK